MGRGYRHQPHRSADVKVEHEVFIHGNRKLIIFLITFCLSQSMYSINGFVHLSYHNLMSKRYQKRHGSDRTRYIRWIQDENMGMEIMFSILSTTSYRNSFLSNLQLQAENSGGGGESTGGISNTLNLIRHGARLIRELDQHDIDEEEIQAEEDIFFPNDDKDGKKQQREDTATSNSPEEEEEEEVKQQQQQANELDPKNMQQKQKDEIDHDNKQSGFWEGISNPSGKNVSNTLNSTSSNSSSNNIDVNDKDNENDSNNTVGEMVQARLDAFDRRAKRTRILLLKKIASWVFDKCVGSSPTEEKKNNSKPKERINRQEFYAGILLVHLHLAKYVGVAACHPPTKDQIDELFVLADHDRSGYLDKMEFTNAVVVACAPITSRIAIYWSLLAILPLIVAHTMGGIGHILRVNIVHYKNLNRLVSSSLYQKALAILEWSIEHVVSIVFFSILVPNIFARIDRATRRRARERSQRRATSTSLWWLRMPTTLSTSSSQKADWADWMNEEMKRWGDWFNQGMTGRWKVSPNDDSRGDDLMSEENIEDGGLPKKKRKSWWRSFSKPISS